MWFCQSTTFDISNGASDIRIVCDKDFCVERMSAGMISSQGFPIWLNGQGVWMRFHHNFKITCRPSCKDPDIADWF